MSEPFLGEVKIFAGSFAPQGWAFCTGQDVPIRQNTALFALLGTTYGGDGVNTFKLPDLRGRAPVGAGVGPGLTPRPAGQTFGVEQVTLNATQLPAHGHALVASTANGNQATPAIPARPYRGNIQSSSTVLLYSAGAPSTPLGNSAGAGGGQPHPNQMPYTGLNYIIALQGIFPPRS